MTYIPDDLRAQMDAARAELVGKGFDPREFALDLLARELTEERTDKLLDLLIEAVESKLPWWGRWAVGAVRAGLDALLPDQLIAALRKALA